MTRYNAEADLAVQLKACGIRFEREWQLHPTRKWRLDFACWRANGNRAAVEIQGGGGRGRHGSSKGIRLDCEKASACAAFGWPLVKADATQVKSGAALSWILFVTDPRGPDPFAKPPKKRARVKRTQKRTVTSKLPERFLKAAGMGKK